MEITLVGGSPGCCLNKSLIDRYSGSVAQPETKIAANPATIAILAEVVYLQAFRDTSLVPFYRLIICGGGLIVHDAT